MGTQTRANLDHVNLTEKAPSHVILTVSGCYFGDPAITVTRRILNMGGTAPGSAARVGLIQPQVIELV